MSFYSKLCRFATIAAVLPVAAYAQQAVINQGANLRAGPSNTYPIVAQLASGIVVNVQGCVAGYQWCDVVLPDGALRGWVYAQSLSYPYQGQPVPLAQYGATIGIPLLSFTLGNYWGSHYRDRPFYREPRYWGGRPPPRDRDYRGPNHDYRGPRTNHPGPGMRNGPPPRDHHEAQRPRNDRGPGAYDGPPPRWQEGQGRSRGGQGGGLGGYGGARDGSDNGL